MKQDYNKRIFDERKVAIRDIGYAANLIFYKFLIIRKTTNSTIDNWQFILN